MPMESWVKFQDPQKISGASEQTDVAAWLNFLFVFWLNLSFSLKTVQTSCYDERR